VTFRRKQFRKPNCDPVSSSVDDHDRAAKIDLLLKDLPCIDDMGDPYGEIVRFLAQHREKKAAVFETLRYFDGVNFARQCKAAALFSVGLMDDVCPPSTVYGAYNAYAGDKTIVEYEFNNHEGGQAYQQREQMAWLSARFGII